GPHREPRHLRAHARSRSRGGTGLRRAPHLLAPDRIGTLLGRARADARSFTGDARRGIPRARGAAGGRGPASSARGAHGGGSGRRPSRARAAIRPRAVRARAAARSDPTRRARVAHGPARSRRRAPGAGGGSARVGPAPAGVPMTLAPRPIAMTIGVFDGLHRGHQRVIAATVEAAREVEGSAVVTTFDPHPDAIVRGAPTRAWITPPDEREALLHDLGVDRVHVVRFDKEVQALA